MSLRKAWRVFLSAGCCGLMALSARAGEVPVSGLQAITFGGQDYLVKMVDPHKADLRLFLKDDSGQFLSDFVGLDKYVQSKGEKLVFAANAGMFQPDSRPVGLLVQNGTEQSPLNLKDGTGNFCMKPNGVFLLNAMKHERHGCRIEHLSCASFASHLGDSIRSLVGFWRKYSS